MDFNSSWLKLSGIKNQRGALGAAIFVSACLLLSNCQALPPDDTSPSIQPGSGTQPSNITSGLEGYLPVDCLLPGQVRRLGSQITYVTARRPIRTSANRCEIRGGEYVSYDRANYETALEVWLEKAKTGDAKAQTYVGEIYEKGMGRPPDYKEAAKWYQQGADQEYSPAQTKLGLLYEKGLGVAQNKEMALQLYRRASGLEDLGVQFGASTEIGKLKEDLIHQRNEVGERLLQSNHELEQLTRERKQLQDERERMEEGRKKLQEIEQSKEELVAKDQRLAQKEHDLKGKEEQIDTRSLKLENQKQSLEAQERDLFIKRQELARQMSDNPPENEKLSQMNIFKTEIGKLKKDLINQRNEVGEQQLQLNHELKQLTRERKQLQDERERMEEGRKKLQEIEQSKEELVAKDQRLAQKEHDLKGKEEQIDTLSFRLENQKQSLEARARDLFEKRKKITRQELDNPPENEKLSPMKSFDIDYGKSYALIIGISKYKNLDPLQTAANDAKEIEKVLKSKYDFTHIDLLVDERATHDGIFKKLIYYQRELVAQDNFLIYYAGHGKLENGEGYWLPVNAHDGVHMKKNWISNKDVSSLASTFDAKHVIIVADSCYSGAIATQGTTPWFPSDLSDDQKQSWLETMMGKHGVRMSLTSGGLKPVYDNLGGSHSFFAEALLTTLEKNTRKFLAASTVWNQVGNYMYGHLFPKKSEGIVRGEIQGHAIFDHFPEPRFSSLNMTDQSIGQFFFVLKS